MGSVKKRQGRSEVQLKMGEDKEEEQGEDGRWWWWCGEMWSSGGRMAMNEA